MSSSTAVLYTRGPVVRPSRPSTTRQAKRRATRAQVRKVHGCPGSRSARRTAVAAIVLCFVCWQGLPSAAPRVGASFHAAAEYPLGTYGPPHALSVADVNGDGHPDLLAATCESNTECGSVTLFLGNGDGTFRGPLSLGSGGNGASAIAVADVTADGHPDLVVANFASDTVGVLAGRADGWFDAATTYRTTTDASGAVGPSAIAVADLRSRRDRRPGRDARAGDAGWRALRVAAVRAERRRVRRARHLCRRRAGGACRGGRRHEPRRPAGPRRES